MTHKQFLLIFVVWCAAIIAIFATPARSAEVGIVQAPGVTCAQAQEDKEEVVKRIIQLKGMYEQTDGQSGRLVIKTEIMALYKLLVVINTFQTENCKET